MDTVGEVVMACGTVVMVCPSVVVMVVVTCSVLESVVAAAVGESWLVMEGTRVMVMMEVTGGVVGVPGVVR